MPSQPGFWRKCRIGFRWCRISVLLLVLVFVGILFWFNRVSLPDFLKRPLVRELRAHGIELEFSRLRLSFIRGLVAENVRIGDAKVPGQPTLSLNQLQLDLNFHALWHRQLQIEGLFLRQGKLTWPLSPTNTLVLNHIQTDLRFQTNDTWSLDQFQADFAGAKLSLSGHLAHASEFPLLKVSQISSTSNRTNSGVWLQQLKKISATLDRIHFSGAAELNVSVNGDTRDFHSLALHVNGDAAAAQTPWFSGRDIQFAAILTTPASAPTNFDASWGFWTNAQPYRLEWTARLKQLRTEKLNINSVSANGFWQAPELAITSFSADLGSGELDARARMNVATRELIFTNSSDFDLDTIKPLLTEKIRKQLAEFSLTQPPVLHVAGSLTLPAWTNHQSNWPGQVQPSLRLVGDVALTNSTIHSIAIDSVRTHFSYSNLVWHLSDFYIAQQKTRLEMDGTENAGTKNYRLNVQGAFDPKTLWQLLPPDKAAKIRAHFTFTEPLALNVKMNGRWHDFDSFDASGQVALTNFTIRGQSVDSLAGALHYTNGILTFFHPQLWREGGTQMMKADIITLDFHTLSIYFKNGFSTADPEAVARAIGPKTGRLLEPYHFLQPPTALVNGRSPMRDVRDEHDMGDADLRFDIVKPVPFQWLKLRTPALTGTIHWLGATLILTNVAGSFYGGIGRGHAFFDFLAPHEGADFHFTVNVTNANLHLLAADLSTPTNRLEGIFSGELAVTNADSRTWRSWNGYGHANLHDGLLWDIPIFSIFSPVLNAVWPGLGNSRATDAKANFTLTNGVIFSKSLEIRSTMMRLDYNGTVDLKQNVNAHVTAQLLRDAWVIGPLVSTVLSPVSKLFEYRVTGTLESPKLEPIYVPKPFLIPLHPLRTLEEIFSAGSNTNKPTKN